MNAQDPASSFGENLPDVHAGQEASSEVLEEPWTKPWPGGHFLIDFSAHGAALFEGEYLPGVQGVQVAAVNVESIKPWPVGQEVVVCALHAVVSVVAENVPNVHEEHAASSAVVEPGEKPWPAGHEETAFALQAVASLVLENVPGAHGGQVAAVVEEPGVKPLPVGHDVVDCVWREGYM